MTEILNEVKRNQHISKTRQSDNYENQAQGKNRYYRRMRSTVDKSVNHLNKMDMNKLFDQGILDINLDINGETNRYIVRISFGQFLKELHNEVKQQEDKFSLPVVTRALVKAFNTDDVLVRCSCPDFVYRQSFWLSMNGGIAGEMETRPSDQTNPSDTKGSGCKHIQAVLSTTNWLQRVARVVYNYINYMQQHFQGLYAEKIYPAIYEKNYDDLYQQDLDFSMDKDELNNNEVQDDSDMIDTANKWAREKGRFKPGNEYRFQKSTEDPNQIELDLGQPDKEFDIDSAY